ncbi:MAG: methylated-DNA--[protein]-cysteine S-methyltransferase [Alphaproteobacteria bacterium]|nr:methylated-DNA--[protein]-cysteine S-methyltransferase [Alphaproteobacteria bacterium]
MDTMTMTTGRTASPRIAARRGGGGDPCHAPYHASIDRALRYLARHWRQQPDLAEAARAAGMSEYHFQRVFTRWVGVSPKKFLGYLTLDSAKAALERGESVLDAAYEAGLSGPSRLHDLFVGQEAVTPGEYKSRGRGLAIGYGFAPSPFGECLILWTARGICGLGFVMDGNRGRCLADMRARWRDADFREDAAQAHRLAARVFSPVEQRRKLGLVLMGSPFQVKVWEALLQVPEGALVSYDRIAAAVGKPRAARAVGGAVGANPIAFLIPCHRAIRKTGAIGEYRWGGARKLALIGWEQAQAERGRAA